MSYVFSDELRLWIDSQNLSRRELIEQLQSYNHSEFGGLDTITLSRWINGKTTPPLYKQFHIAKCLKIDLIDVICRIDSSSLKISERINKGVLDLIRLLDLSALSLSYKKIPMQSVCKIKKQTFQEHYDYFSNYHKNICALRPFFQELYSLEDKVQYKCITLENDKGELVGHYCGIKDLTPLRNISLFQEFNHIDVNTSSLINVGHFKNSKQYFELLDYAISYYFLKAYPSISTLYLFVAGHPIYDVTKNLLGLEKLKYYPPMSSDSKLGVYLFEIDIIKAICNPILFPSAQRKIKCLKECASKNCNLCNLRDFL